MHPLDSDAPRAARPPRRASRAVIAASLLGAALLQAAGGDAPARFDHSRYPERLRRAESFLGIHFDFHAGTDGTEIGRHTSRAMVEAIIDAVHPDYIQTDCKGHPGLSSYPTRVGHPAPGFVGDPLRIWREVTAERGVALYMHYSGVWDNEAVRRHPDWARVTEAGRPDDRLTSVFGPYAERLLIPQLKELRDVYGVDGVWIDGECWAVAHDYSDAALRAFRETTGVTAAPRKPSDPHWPEFTAFQREAFRRYVRHYVDTLHRHDPDFQIASNWAFSDHMPEPVTIAVDFLSGDYSLQDSVNSARFSARCLAPQGQAWDLMAWAFGGRHGDPAHPLKTVPQLQREAAVVLAQGGGFQAYFKQKRDGSIHDWQMGLMAEVARFCRARQAVCHRSVTVPQVALLYSTAAHYRQSPRLFAPASPGVDSLKGLLQSLLDSQQSVDIRSEHHLRGRLADYPLLVLPDWDYLEPEFKQALLDHARQGGRLLLAGPKITALFEADLGLRGPAEPATGLRWLAHDGWLAPVPARLAAPALPPAARAFGRLHAEDDPRSIAEPAAILCSVGQGVIAATSIDLGAACANGKTAVTRDFLGALVRELLPQPRVEVTGSRQVEVVLARQPGRWLVNLINTSGPHADRNVHTFDEIAPVGPLQVRLRTATRPRRVRLEPGATRLAAGYRDGVVTVTVPRLEIHSIIVVE